MLRFPVMYRRKDAGEMIRESHYAHADPNLRALAIPTRGCAKPPTQFPTSSPSLLSLGRGVGGARWVRKDGKGNFWHSLKG